MRKFCQLSILLILLFKDGNAQQSWISGYLKDSITHFPIANGTISNFSNNTKVQTRPDGLFRITVSPNDVLNALAGSYHDNSLRYSLLFGDTLTIFLSPSGNILPGVTISSQYTKYQADSIERRSAFKHMQGTSLNAVSPGPRDGFGVTINLDRFTKKKYRNKRKEEELFEKTELAAYINYRYSPQLVAFYTGLRGDSLRSFLFRYTPDYKWLRKHTSNEEVVYYISDKLKEYHRSAGIKKE